MTYDAGLGDLPAAIALALAPIAPLTAEERQALRDKLREEYDTGLDGFVEDDDEENER